MSTNTHLARPNSPYLDRILGEVYHVLDDGFVRVVDYMGNESSIAQAARVSWGSEAKNPAADAKLLRRLIRDRHTSPFEMCEIKLHIRAPMDAWRQWIRHRMAGVNEYSTRYRPAIDSVAKTKPGAWRMQDKNNKQGSDGVFNLEVGSVLTVKEQQLHDLINEVYQERLTLGVANEQARKDLSLSNYTEAYWKMDLHNLIHFLGLRMDSHAQFEIRQYANMIGGIVGGWVPNVWGAFRDFRLNGMSMSDMDKQVLKAILTLGGDVAAVNLAKEFGWLDKTSSERKEFEKKASELGVNVPWTESDFIKE